MKLLTLVVIGVVLGLGHCEGKRSCNRKDKDYSSKNTKFDGPRIQEVMFSTTGTPHTDNQITTERRTGPKISPGKESLNRNFWGKSTNTNSFLDCRRWSRYCRIPSNTHTNRQIGDRKRIRRKRIQYLVLSMTIWPPILQTSIKTLSGSKDSLSSTHVWYWLVLNLLH